jgi:hypothetical protein
MTPVIRLLVALLVLLVIVAVLLHPMVTIAPAPTIISRMTLRMILGMTRMSPTLARVRVVPATSEFGGL